MGCEQLKLIVAFTRIAVLARGINTNRDKVCQWKVSSTNKTDRHDLTEISLKVALNTIKPNQTINTNLIKDSCSGLRKPAIPPDMKISTKSWNIKK